MNDNEHKSLEESNYFKFWLQRCLHHASYNIKNM